MQISYPRKMETNRALREVILSIVESNLKEAPHVVPNHQIVEKVFTSFQRAVYFSNGIYVELSDEEITIRISVNVSRECSLVRDLNDLQERIYLDIFQLTGLKVSAINILVKNIILEENKKTQ
jgi:uncharacterized alkaline shock family protein YloU